MPRDPSGNYTLPAGNPVVSGTTIDSSWANGTMNDLANEITNSLSRNGNGGMNVPLPFADGSQSAPGITFTAEPTTGIFRQANGVVGVTGQSSIAALFDGPNGQVLVQGAAPTAANHATRKDYVDAADAALQAGVDANTANVATNTGDIATNTADIAALQAMADLILDTFVGTVHGFSGVPITGAYWSVADGRALSRTTYSKLFAVIGTQYGDGDGSTTFNVPDYRGYFLRFENMGGGIDPDAAARTDRGDGTGGDNVGSIQSFALENITGSLNRFHGGFTSGSGAFAVSGSNNFPSTGGGASANQSTFDASRVAQTSTETRPANKYVTPYIFTGAQTP